ncbi:MAG: alpha/beta fold hydrolase [Christensenellales bacterium]|jgi:pimeloyl-ACP methyl ester carboxylesterase
MVEKVFVTEHGRIHYWVNPDAERMKPQLVFLPGLTVDHRLFDKQIEYFEGEYPILVWDAPGHAASYPFRLRFSLEDKARWIDAIRKREGFDAPVLIGQSMGGYVGQMYSQLFPDGLKGLVSIDSAPLQRKYYSDIELWLLKQMEPMYRLYPWNILLKATAKRVATTEYGRKIMREFMMVYDSDRQRYTALAGHGFRILAEAVERNLPYEIKCPALLICGEEDRAGSCIRYNKAWHRETGIPIEWIKDAGHNSNTDKPDEINRLIEKFIAGIQQTQ